MCYYWSEERLLSHPTDIHYQQLSSMQLEVSVLFIAQAYETRDKLIKSHPELAEEEAIHH